MQKPNKTKTFGEWTYEVKEKGERLEDLSNFHLKPKKLPKDVAMKYYTNKLKEYWERS